MVGTAGELKHDEPAESIELLKWETNMRVRTQN